MQVILIEGPRSTMQLTEPLKSIICPGDRMCKKYNMRGHDVSDIIEGPRRNLSCRVSDDVRLNQPMVLRDCQGHYLNNQEKNYKNSEKTL